MTAIAKREIILSGAEPLGDRVGRPFAGLASAVVFCLGVLDSQLVEQLHGVFEVEAAANLQVEDFTAQGSLFFVGDIVPADLAFNHHGHGGPAEWVASGRQADVPAVLECIAGAASGGFDFQFFDGCHHLEETLPQVATQVCVQVEDNQAELALLDQVERFADIGHFGEYAVEVRDDNRIAGLCGGQYQTADLTLAELAIAVGGFVEEEPAPGGRLPFGLDADKQIEGVLDDSFLLRRTQELLVRGSASVTSDDFDAIVARMFDSHVVPLNQEFARSGPVRRVESLHWPVFV